MGKGVFGNGWLELKRKWHRRQLRKQLAEHDHTRSKLLGRLGEQARLLGVDLSAHASLRDELSALEGRAGELAASGTALESQRAALEERRRAEVSRFDGQRAAVEAEKRPIDAELAAARQRLTRQETAVRSTSDRRQALGLELEQLRQRSEALIVGTAPDRDAELASARDRSAQIEADRAALAEELRLAGDAVPPLAADVDRLASESQKHAAEVGRIETERKNVLHAIDGELRAVRGQLDATGTSAKKVNQERWGRLVALGSALYDGQDPDARLSAAIGAVTAENQRRAASQAVFDASLAETRATPPNTVGKFFVATLAVLLVALALPLGGYAAWQWRSREEPEHVFEQEPVATELVGSEYVEAEPPSVNPYLDHDLRGRDAYLLANRLADAQSEEEAEAVLLEVFRRIGLGVYAPSGIQVQAGAERSENDFFLYDFQLGVLSRSQIHPSYLTFGDFSHFLGDAIAELEDPGDLQPLLAEAVSSRYREASRAPADPASFIVLFLDGLARRQPIPYSLAEVSDHDAERLYMSPVQSLLLVLEFFMEPPAPRRAGLWLPTPWSLVREAHAPGPCDLIQGDQAQSNFGRGSDILIGIAGLFGGMFGEIASKIGNATGVVGAAGDMLTLYGVDIHVQPQPYTIHLLHDESVVAGIVTTVTFDAEVVSDEVLKCGYMAGKKMPVKGPLPGVELTWEFSPVLPPYLEMHREMTLTGHLGLQTKTDEGGSSLFLIQPMQCRDRTGRIRGQDYMATVSARVVTAEMPTPAVSFGPGLILKLGPGTIETLMRGRKGYARFRAEWHEKPPKDDQYKSGG